MLVGRLPYGLYHLANEGQASLHELMTEIVSEMGLDVKVIEGSHQDFPSIGTKNKCTPIASCKIDPLRPWRDAVTDYCKGITV